MESLSNSYEKMVNQIQFLKKQVSGEKLAHENTLKQLQSTYQIIDEIKEALRMEQTNSLKLKTQLSDKTIKMATITNQYQEQISDIKEMILLKDDQLKRLSSVLIVSDYDMVRLRVVNQLQLTHKEELQRLNHQINKKAAEIAEVRSKSALMVSKSDFLADQLKKSNQQRIQQKEALNKRYMEQIKNLYQSIQKQRNQANRWSKKYELLETKSKKQADNLKQQISKLSRELQIQNRALLSNTNGKSTKIKLEKLEQQFMKLKEELQQQKQTNKKLEDQIVRLKKQIKMMKKQESDSKILKDKLEDHLEQLKREMQTKQNQRLRDLQTLKQQYQNKSDSQSNLAQFQKQKINRLELQNKRLSFHLQSKDEQILQLKQKSKENNLNIIRKQLEEKTQEIQQLVIELNSFKKKERTKSLYEKQDASILKKKLNDANQKIVGLLKQKIELHRQISKYKNVKGQ